ncbi:hypothetical protein ABW19_dt0209902 [Dactylella cylindrospora]|nr:hypothetical protein ABW19_dt0209902 [Dactylella cylindrospora]
MSSRLWGAYFENDLDKFRSLLGLSDDRAGGTHNINNGSLTNESPFDLSSPPRRQSTFGSANADSKGVTLNRFQINSRLPANILVNPLAPATGLTILHHAATANKVDFVDALLKHPQTDVFLQDFESGWTALHRALYFGNISVAKQILGKDEAAIGLVKIKDREGNSPFELFESTIKVETAKASPKPEAFSTFDGDEDEEGAGAEQHDLEVGEFKGEFLGDEAFVWGSNKNLSLGFSDGDDRQFPERILVPGPSSSKEPQDAVVVLAPVYIKDIQMAKFHTAIITTAASNNLYVCGHGPGGRLGLGHESTEFTFKSVVLPRKVRTVALGQDHTVAILDNGDVFSWGTGRYGQLGYPPNIDKNDKEEYQLSPRQIVTNLRKEKIIGAAVSKHHTVVHTATSVFVFGKNEGQLGLVDSDARSLEAQMSPRKVAAALFDQPISMITATDKATAMLLENHEVWMFMNFGVMKVTFPFDRFPNTGIKPTRPTSKHLSRPNFVTKISSGGGTIAALSRMGDVFTINVDKSTATNTRSLPVAQRIWSLKKRHMAVRDVDVGQEGAVIICTESGSVWQRTRRSKVKEASGFGNPQPNLGVFTPQQVDRAKDYKFTRIPGLTHIAAVRSNAFGSFAAVRRDVDILRTKLEIRQPTLWDDLGSLVSFYDEDLDEAREKDGGNTDMKRRIQYLRESALKWFLKDDLESFLKETIHEMDLTEYDTVIKTPELDEMGISIPAHSFILTGRCPQLRSLFSNAITSKSARYEELAELRHQPGGTFDLTFKGIDWLSLLIFIFYLYKDIAVSVWAQFSKDKERMRHFQRVRADLGLLAKHFGLKQLSSVVSGLYTIQQTMDFELEAALSDPEFWATGDMLLELRDRTIKVHSSLLCARCSFFDALYHGGSGRWLASRKGEEEYAVDQLVRVDMKHVNFETMEIVLKFLYCDKGLHLFDQVQVVSGGLDGFIDLVIDVLGVANELMLDRLVEVCQRVIGRFVNTRNATSILAAISESSVVEFKSVCLEYVFRNLETMMETRALDEFDDYLMAELDEAVKGRQLAYMPIVRSGRAEAELLERHPLLGETTHNERVLLLQLLEAASNPPFADADSTGSPASYRQSSSFPSGSYEKHRRRRSSKTGQEKQLIRSPPLMPTQGSELIFDMEDEDIVGKLARTPVSHSPGLSHRDSYTVSTIAIQAEVWYDCKGKQITAPEASVARRDDTLFQQNPESPTPRSPDMAQRQPWAIGTGIQSTKLDMREIMAQASKNRTSNLSLGLSSPNVADSTGTGNLPSIGFTAPITAKVSQKERKRQQQQQQLQAQQSVINAAPTPAAAAITSTSDKPAATPKSSPWKNIRSPSNPLSLQQQALSSPTTTPVKEKLLDVINNSPLVRQSPSQTKSASTLMVSPKPPVFGINKQPAQATLPQAQTRRYNTSGDIISSPTRNIPGRSTASQPRSERYDDFPPISAGAEQIQLPLAEIIQQEQIQQDIIKGRIPKQSLQEIQQEQEFLNWWEKETEKYQQEEFQRKLSEQGQQAATARGRGRGGTRGRGRASIRGRGGRVDQGGPSRVHDKEQPAAGASKRGALEGGNARGKRRGRGKGPETSKSEGPQGNV